VTSIRAYERNDLPIEERLPSLARRFPCLEGAEGIDPWEPEVFHRWVARHPEGDPAFHGGLLLLNLWSRGPWPGFDALAAARVWLEPDRLAFIGWMKVWRF